MSKERELLGMALEMLEGVDNELPNHYEWEIRSLCKQIEELLAQQHGIGDRDD